MSGPRISARALIQSQGRVLLSRYRDQRGDWFVFPGGWQRKGETLQACLLREVKEETGLHIEMGPLRWVREFIAADFPDSNIDPEFHQVEITFECILPDGQRAVMGEIPDPGQIGLYWASIAELLTLRFYPQDVAQILNQSMPNRMYLGAV